MDIALLIWNLFLDTSASWLRMFVALAVSAVVSLAVGIWAARSERASKIILPVVDILQTLPILAFFPFVIYIVIVFLPPYFGINAAVVFLIITSMIWNMIFGVYEAIKTLPNEFSDVSKLYKMNLRQRLGKIFIPAAMPRLVEQSVLSWSIGLFYLVTSEIFSTGNASYSVSHGIGVALTQYALSGNFTAYAIGLVIFILFVIATRFLFFRPLEKYFTKQDRFVSTKIQPHKFHNTAMHRIRLFGELERLYRKDISEKLSRRMRKSAGQKAVPQPTQEMIEMHATMALRAKFYAFAAVVAVIILLAVVGIIAPTTATYELESLAALAASFIRVWLTFVIILIVAVPVCVYLIFISKRSEQYLTLFQILASIPATIILPIIAVALAGYPNHGELVAFAVFFLSGIWYIIFSAVADAKTLQKEIFEIKKLFNVRGWNAWKNIYIKAIAPGLITGAVTAIAAEWNASIVAEYFTSTGVGAGTVLSSVNLGIGKLLDIALANNNLTLMLIALINLTIMIILINTFVWKKLYKRVSDVYK